MFRLEEEIRQMIMDPEPEDAGLTFIQRWGLELQDEAMELERRGRMGEAVLFTQMADNVLEMDLNIRSLRSRQG